MNVNYSLLLFWLGIICLSYSSPAFAVLFSAIHILFMFYFLVIAIYLLFAAKSHQKMIAIVFFLPIAIFIIGPHLRDEFHRITTIPDDTVIKKYIKTEHTGWKEILDTSVAIADYDSDANNLDLKLIIMPDIFVKDQSEIYRDIDAASFAKIMMNVMYLNLIELPINVSQVTRLPYTITAYGYWGDKLIMKATFQKNGKKYKLVQPYPFVSLVGSANRLQLQYEIDGQRGSIDLIVEHVPISDFHFNLIRESLK